ncbi:MAG: peptidylprolyl isomerase [Dissulfurispiraceae bacterium]
MVKKIVIAMTVWLIICGTAVMGGAADKTPVVLIKTSLGNIKIELMQKEAPITVKNFLSYVKAGFYNGTIFHRVIPGFMVQGGGFTPEMNTKQTEHPIENEAANGLRNDRGTVAMARTAAPDSATSQFFINLVNNDNLNRPMPDGYGYAVFGKVIDGMNAVDRIASVRTGVTMGFPNVPQTPVVIKSITIVE